MSYWERRYRKGGHSGAGSRGLEAQVKADVVDGLVAMYGAKEVMDLGCGDGYVADLLSPDMLYRGYDPSRTAIAMAVRNAPGKHFFWALPKDRTWDMVLSMDVLQHQVTDQDYQSYMDLLFGLAGRYVLVYGTNMSLAGNPHVLHREWVKDVPAPFELIHHQEAEQFPPKAFWLFERLTT